MQPYLCCRETSFAEVGAASAVAMITVTVRKMSFIAVMAE